MPPVETTVPRKPLSPAARTWICLATLLLFIVGGSLVTLRSALRQAAFLKKVATADGVSYGEPVETRWLRDFLVDALSSQYGSPFEKPLNYTLRGPKFDDKDLAYIAHQPSVVGLFLYNTKISPEGLLSLSQHLKLKSLDLQVADSDDRWLDSILSFQELEWLTLGGDSVNFKSLNRLAQIKSLRTLGFNVPSLDEDAMAQVAAIPQLTTLHFYSMDENRNLRPIAITDKEVHHLRTLPNLIILDISGGNITDMSLEYIGTLKKLTSLGLQGAPITGSGLRHLSSLHSLTYLNLRGTSITDEYLVHLGKMPNLNMLLLDNTQITDEGLELLKTLPKLGQLHISGTKVTSDGLKAFKDFHPEVRVVGL